MEDRHETIMSLLSHYTETSNEGLAAADSLKTIVMLHSFLMDKIKLDPNYIGSADFHRHKATIKATKLELISIVANSFQ
jgi:hypothetical protein